MKNVLARWQSMPGSARLRMQVLFLLVILAIGFSAVSLLRSGDWTGFFANMGSELGGAAITFVLLDQLLHTRERREEIAQEEAETKRSLIDRMGSEVREVAAPAADELRRHGWLTDGSLANAMFRRANLEKVNLSNADLRGANFHRARLAEADLWRANLAQCDMGGAWLNGARLWDANLEGVNLWQARMQNADLRRANCENVLLNEAKLDEADLRETNFKGANFKDARLTGANFHEAILTGCDFTGADLSGVNLRGAILRRAIFDNAIFDGRTLLPDGKYWTPNRDLSGYLDDE